MAHRAHLLLLCTLSVQPAICCITFVTQIVMREKSVLGVNKFSLAEVVQNNRVD